MTTRNPFISTSAAPISPSNPSEQAPWYKDLDAIRGKLILIIREMDRILYDLNRSADREKLPEIIQKYQTLLLGYRELLAILKRSSLHSYLGVPAHLDVNRTDIISNRDLRTKYQSQNLTDLECKYKTLAIEAHPSISSRFYNSLDQASVSRAYNSWKNVIEAQDSRIVGARQTIRSVMAGSEWQEKWKSRLPREDDEIEEEPEDIKKKLEAMMIWMSSGPAFVDIDKVLEPSKEEERKASDEK